MLVRREIYFVRFLSLLDTNKAIKPFLIVDARSYTAAFANRAKGGGFEYQGNDILETSPEICY